MGQGAYASVYSGVDSSCADVALKWEAPPCPWELYVGRALEARLPPHARPCALAPTSLLLGERASLLVAPLGAHGSLQQLLNARLAEAGQVGVVGGWVVGGVWWIARTRAGRLQGLQLPPPPHTHTHMPDAQPLPELAAMHLTAALCRALGAVHAARVLHADVKPDNLLVTVGGAAQQQQEEEDGQDEQGSSELLGPQQGLGLTLIDFGRSIDLELLPPGALMQARRGGRGGGGCCSARQTSTCSERRHPHTHTHPPAPTRARAGRQRHRRLSVRGDA